MSNTDKAKLVYKLTTDELYEELKESVQDENIVSICVDSQIDKLHKMFNPPNLDSMTHEEALKIIYNFAGVSGLSTENAKRIAEELTNLVSLDSDSTDEEPIRVYHIRKSDEKYIEFLQEKFPDKQTYELIGNALRWDATLKGYQE